MTDRCVSALAQPVERTRRACLVELQSQVRHALQIVACVERVFQAVQCEMGSERIQRRPPSLLHGDEHHASRAQQSSVASLHASVRVAEEVLFGDHSHRLVEIRSFHALVRPLAQRLPGVDLQPTRLEHESIHRFGLDDGLRAIAAFGWQRYPRVRSHAR